MVITLPSCNNWCTSGGIRMTLKESNVKCFPKLGMLGLNTLLKESKYLNNVVL